MSLTAPDTAGMATKKSDPAMDFLVEALKRNPKASYGDLKAKADDKKLKVYPIMYGRAQALLGIVKSAKRGQGKVAKASAATAAKATATPKAGKSPGRQIDPSSKSGRIRALLSSGMSANEIAKKVGATPGLVYAVKSSMGKSKSTGTRGPGRLSKSAVSVGMDGLDSILAAVKSSERDRIAMRAALEKIQGVIADVLA